MKKKRWRLLIVPIVLAFVALAYPINPSFLAEKLGGCFNNPSPVWVILVKSAFAEGCSTSSDCEEDYLCCNGQCESCTGKWFISGGQCCKCSNGYGSGPGPVKCCNTCKENCGTPYNVPGCAKETPDPTKAPDPTNTSVPPTSTEVPGEPTATDEPPPDPPPDPPPPRRREEKTPTPDYSGPWPTATPYISPCELQTEGDLPEEYWAYKAIIWAIDEGLAVPYRTEPELVFCPDDPLTMIVMARSIVMAKRVSLREFTDNFFRDITKGSEDAKYAEAYLGLEALTGQDFWAKEFWGTPYERDFCPDRFVLKDEASEILKLFGYSEHTAAYRGDIFSDVFTGTRFATSMEALVVKEVIPDWVLLFMDKYGPKLSITRAQWFWNLHQWFLLYGETSTE